ncbi:MAG TPA: hypothetical protein VJI98_03030 [Candidatus Nanoarchaeia archaeon]|nr:hypothetical protein [Candidatus Nanoarchaeia archaeon]
MISKRFLPGKFVASNYGTVFHTGVCSWASKIDKKRRVWFRSEKEAVSKGYKEHSCV